MRMTLDHLTAIAGGTLTAARRSNMQSILAGLDAMGEATGLDRAHRLAHYLAQLAHESGRFVYDRELVGPTPAQRRYEGRADLGNDEPGDGLKFVGHTPMQITGRGNTEAFRDWCRDQGLAAPDFAETPASMNTDPWEGLGPIWYWSTRNLNRYADANNIEMVTRRINGGLNGYADRLKMYERAALVLLGRKLEAGVVKRFQADHGLIADDIVGPATRAAMHKALVAATAEDADPPASEPVAVPAPRPVEPRPAEPDDWQPQLTVTEYLAIIETSTAAIRKLTAGA